MEFNYHSGKIIFFKLTLANGLATPFLSGREEPLVQNKGKMNYVLGIDVKRKKATILYFT